MEAFFFILLLFVIPTILAVVWFWIFDTIHRKWFWASQEYETRRERVTNGLSIQVIQLVLGLTILAYLWKLTSEAEELWGLIFMPYPIMMGLAVAITTWRGVWRVLGAKENKDL